MYYPGSSKSDIYIRNTMWKSVGACMQFDCNYTKLKSVYITLLTFLCYVFTCSEGHCYDLKGRWNNMRSYNEQGESCMHMCYDGRWWGHCSHKTSLYEGSIKRRTLNTTSGITLLAIHTPTLLWAKLGYDFVRKSAKLLFKPVWCCNKCKKLRHGSAGACRWISQPSIS